MLHCFFFLCFFCAMWKGLREGKGQSKSRIWLPLTSKLNKSFLLPFLRKVDSHTINWAIECGGERCGRETYIKRQMCRAHLSNSFSLSHLALSLGHTQQIRLQFFFLNLEYWTDWRLHFVFLRHRHFVCLPVYLSVCLSGCLSVWLSVCVVALEMEMEKLK